MGRALVGVILGSRADFNIMRRGLESLRIMGVPYVFELASAHRTPERVTRFAQTAGENGIEVIVCAAGGSAQIAGMIAAYTNLPVIAVPIDSTPLRGQDAIYSMVQMPPGVPVATVGINNGENAALLATQILALKHERFRAVLAHRRMSLAQRLEGSAKELFSEYPDLCDVEKTCPEHRTSIGEEDTDPGGDPGPEDITPEPPEDREKIRPGAVSVHRQGSGPNSNAEHLVRTPPPQEPSSSNGESQRTDTADMLPKPSEEELESAPGFGLGPTPLAIEQIPDTDPLGTSREEVSREADTQPDEEAAPLPLVETKVFEIDHDSPDEDVLTHAMMVLLEGGVVAFPTDTVYGLAADALNPDAVKKLYEVKGQSSQRKSLSILIQNRETLSTLVRDVPEEVEDILARFWPGGLTVLFYRLNNILNTVSDSPSIAVRIPNDEVPLELMKMVDRPLAVINAATPDNPSPTTAEEVLERFKGRIDCILDAGECRGTDTSTVLSVLSEPYEILREGTVPADQLHEMLGERLKEV